MSGSSFHALRCSVCSGAKGFTNLIAASSYWLRTSQLRPSGTQLSHSKNALIVHVLQSNFWDENSKAYHLPALVVFGP